MIQLFLLASNLYSVFKYYLQNLKVVHYSTLTSNILSVTIWYWLFDILNVAECPWIEM